MKNKILSIIASITMVTMFLPDINAMNCRDKGMSKSDIVKTIVGAAGAGLIVYGIVKGWKY